MEKQSKHIHVNLINILQDHLQTDLKCFNSNFRLRLKLYRTKINEIVTFIKENSLNRVDNLTITCFIDIPQCP